MRKAIKFYNSYFEVASQLNDKDRLAFYDALFNKQFKNIEPNLKGMAKFAYISQKHSIDAQVKGYYDITKDEQFNPNKPPTQGGTIPPSKQVKEQVKEEEQIIIEFDVFWNLYNKKLGNKDICEKKWNNLKNDDRKKIIDTLPTFINSIKDKQYQPYPETYLNNKRWNDEITTEKKILSVRIKSVAEQMEEMRRYGEDRFNQIKEGGEL